VVEVTAKMMPEITANIINTINEITAAMFRHKDL
jgi:ABC-type arginine transport system ATPase subunit